MAILKLALHLAGSLVLGITITAMGFVSFMAGSSCWLLFSFIPPLEPGELFCRTFLANHYLNGNDGDIFMDGLGFNVLLYAHPYLCSAYGVRSVASRVAKRSAWFS